MSTLPQAPAVPLEGKLGDPTILPRLYVWLSKGEWSGMVIVRTGDVERRVYFVDGRVTTAGSNEASDTLASRLVSEGILTFEDVTTAAAALRMPDRGFGFGRQLVRMGKLSEPDLLRTERRRVVAIAEATLAARTGHYRSESGALAGDAVPSQSLPVPRLVAEGVLESWDANSALEALGGPDAILELVIENLSDHEATGAEEAYDLTLLRANGRRTLREVLAMSPLPEPAALRFLAASRLIGSLSLVTVASPRPAIAAEAAESATVSGIATTVDSESMPTDRVAEGASGDDTAELTSEDASDDTDAAGSATLESPALSATRAAAEALAAGSSSRMPSDAVPARAPGKTRSEDAVAGRRARRWLVALLALVVLAGLAYVAWRGWLEVAADAGPDSTTSLGLERGGVSGP